MAACETARRKRRTCSRFCCNCVSCSLNEPEIREPVANAVDALSLEYFYEVYSHRPQALASISSFSDPVLKSVYAIDATLIPGAARR